MFSYLFRSLALCATLTALTDAYTITFYRGLNCRGEVLSSLDVGVGSPSSREFLAASISLKRDEGGKDSNTAIVFFNGDDCYPSDIMKDGDGYSEEGCFTANYGSYEVWDLGSWDH
ncbi:hypothetical protein BU23DRAFT_454666 [Bimuria novae-zelandiae CBS 107.79]|uniref:Uncharacterized protein n=1 Tax=Bimuria novae-zelandiae CBS 107.79 TaxID=1447943 RepID=A0A6A5VM16_9PLEO|nr:hypothetical protein BU23DRAFT_454666 [Bimuria novae-zelandiae CBS 107.79]